jgi:predicted dithiol-disulfide oxidoreductase (DUF899 family)
MSTTEIQETEREISALVKKLYELRKKQEPVEVKNYVLKEIEGDTSLLALFGDKDKLVAIHNMGQGCRYCTLWADGFNAFLPHLEDSVAVVLLSKDAPEQQRRFALSRQWRFRMASHGGGQYIREQSVYPDQDNAPGMVCYVRKGDKVYRANATGFGPGDSFCAQWHILSLFGIGWDDWTPQYSYWQRPARLDDGGENVR